MPVKTPAAAAPVAVVAPPAAPAQPPLPKWPVNEAPKPAAVTFNSQGLRVEAANSSLEEILNQIATETGLQITGLQIAGLKVQGFNTATPQSSAQPDQRIFGIYGPASTREVLSELLAGSGYNILMVGDQGQGTPRKLVLSARNDAAGASPTRNSASNTGDEEDQGDQPDATDQPIRRPPNGFVPPDLRGMPGRTPQEMMQLRQQQIQQQMQQMQQNPNAQPPQ